MVEAIAKVLGSIHSIKGSSIILKEFPSIGAKKLEEKIRSSIAGVLELVEHGKMILVDPKDLEKIIEKMEIAGWQKNHPKRRLKSMDEVDSNALSNEIRQDITTQNYSSGVVTGMRFMIKGKEGNKEIIAAVYNIGGERKILLLRDIVEHPFVARKLLALMLAQYRNIKKGRKK